MPPVITRLADAGRGRVAVELDEAGWRTFPGEAVARAGLVVGMPLDRSSVRRLNRELRRSQAMAVALGALRSRDHSRRSLTERLEHRGVNQAESREALETLERAGLVDDVRTARGRALALADRSAGDLLIRDDLERRGYTSEVIDLALSQMEPEADRLRRIVARHGESPRTLRRLAVRGFGDELLASLIADDGRDELG
jgi:regulatory protein